MTIGLGLGMGFISSKRGGAAFVDPNSVANITLFLDYTDTANITKDGSNLISQVTGKATGVTNNATQSTSANKPLWVDAQLNGKPIARFDGTTDSFSTSGTTSITGEETVFVVCKGTAFTSTFSPMLGGTWLISYLFGTEQTTSIVRWSAGGNTNSSSALRGSASRTLNDNQWCTYRGRRSVANNLIEYYANGALVYSTTHTTGGTFSGTYIIGRDGNNNRFTGDMAYTITFNRALSDNECASIEEWLRLQCLHYSYPTGITDYHPGTQLYFHAQGYSALNQLPARRKGTLGIGQSNEGGAGPIANLPLSLVGPITNAFIWPNTSNGSFATLTAGVNNNPFVANCHGPEMSISYDIAADFTYSYYIKYFVGGTSLATRWHPNTTPVSNNLYLTALGHLDEARFVLGHTTGIDLQINVDWYQGEEDSNTSLNANAYQANEAYLFARLKSDIVGSANMKIASHLIALNSNPVGLSTVNAAKATNASAISYVTTVPAWTTTVDGTHADSAAQVLAGNQAAVVFGATTQAS